MKTKAANTHSYTCTYTYWCLFDKGNFNNSNTWSRRETKTKWLL